MFLLSDFKTYFIKLTALLLNFTLFLYQMLSLNVVVCLLKLTVLLLVLEKKSLKEKATLGFSNH